MLGTGGGVTPKALVGCGVTPKVLPNEAGAVGILDPNGVCCVWGVLKLLFPKLLPARGVSGDGAPIPPVGVAEVRPPIPLAAAGLTYLALSLSSRP